MSFATRFLLAQALFSAFLAVGFCIQAKADEQVPVSTHACYRAKHIVDWHFEKSPNIYNGKREATAYLLLQFEQGRDRKGFLRTEIARIPLTNMVWDESFDSVYFLPAGNKPAVKCAEQHWWGQKRFEKNCALTGTITERPDLSQTLCEGEDTVQFDGSLVILKK